MTINNIENLEGILLRLGGIDLPVCFKIVIENEVNNLFIRAFWNKNLERRREDDTAYEENVK